MGKKEKDNHLHTETRYVTPAACGYDSYYPEYEEYLYEEELADLSEKITLLIMIMLSRYPAKVTLYNFDFSDWKNKAIKEFDPNLDLEKIRKTIKKAMVWHKHKDYTLEFEFADEDANNFYITVYHQLDVTYADVPPSVKSYLIALTEKVGLSSFLEWN